MRLHCNTYGHWKDILICSMSCPYTQRCKQFRGWREEEGNEEILWKRILGYLRAHPNNAYELLLTPMASKQREKALKRYACVNEDQILLLTEEEITQHLLEGIMFEEIIELGRTMEVQIRLVPAGKTKKSKSKTPSAKEAKPDKDEEEEDTAKANGVSRSKSKKKAQTQASA